MTDQCSHVSGDVGVVTVTYAIFSFPPLLRKDGAPKETRCNCGADFLVSHPCRRLRVKDGAPVFFVVRIFSFPPLLCKDGAPGLGCDADVFHPTLAGNCASGMGNPAVSSPTSPKEGDMGHPELMKSEGRIPR
jgi:hypothetical protein